MTTLMKKRRRNSFFTPESQLLTPWSSNLLRPWGNRLFEPSLTRFDDIFDNDFLEENSLMPAMNVQEHEEDFEIEFAAPSFNKKDFEVFIEEDVLHVRGEKEEEDETKDEDYTRKEFRYKSFEKSMTKIPDFSPTSISSFLIIK